MPFALSNSMGSFTTLASVLTLVVFWHPPPPPHLQYNLIIFNFFLTAGGDWLVLCLNIYAQGGGGGDSSGD